DEDLTEVQIEACRPSIIRDIEKVRPRIIIGVGSDVLYWAIKSNKISLWRGRYLPIKVGKHTAWFFPVSHPDILINYRKDWIDYGSDEELAFKFDMKRAFRLLNKLPDPHVETPDEAKQDVHVVTNFSDLQGWFDVLNQERVAGFDWETPAL